MCFARRSVVKRTIRFWLDAAFPEPWSELPGVQSVASIPLLGQAVADGVIAAEPARLNWPQKRRVRNCVFMIILPSCTMYEPVLNTAPDRSNVTYVTVFPKIRGKMIVDVRYFFPLARFG
jgi:hypothetical protein